ncbi:hypothetical protein D3C72_2544080 [compost metagenome]
MKLVERLFGQNQLAQLGRLQTVRGAVVHDGDAFLAAQQQFAVHAHVLGQNGMVGRTVCQYGLFNRNAARGWE